MPSIDMATHAPARLLVSRDHDILAALDWAPLTGRQLLKLSAIWPRPFSSLRMTRERMQQLTDVGLVKTFRYATLSPGQPENYYVLSRAGFQTLYGPDASLPAKGQFEKVAISRHVHTRALADFLTQIRVAAHRSGVELVDFHRENGLRLENAGQSLYPDAAFVVNNRGTAYRFFVEIDCATERLRSEVSERTWQRKARVYAGVQDRFPRERFRVLVVVAQATSERLRHILQTAAEAQDVPERTLFYGVCLASYLASFPSARTPAFVDHRGRSQSLVPDVTANQMTTVDNRGDLRVAKTA